jgi:hypothetical protein
MRANVSIHPSRWFTRAGLNAAFAAGSRRSRDGDGTAEVDPKPTPLLKAGARAQSLDELISDCEAG